MQRKLFIARSRRLDRWAGLLMGFALLAGFSTRAAWAEPPSLETARKLFLTGKYEEALESYEAIAAAREPEQEPGAVGGKPAAEPAKENAKPNPAAEAQLGIARCQLATGHYEDAATSLATAQKAFPNDARFVAESAWLAHDEGAADRAGELVTQALKLDAAQPLAHYVQALLDTEAGRLDAADKGYHWFVDFYNHRDIKDPDVLRLVGLASAQYARWHRLQDQFGFLVNEFWADTLAANPDYWPAHYEAGRLYMEKFNEADAERELKAAVSANPSSAEAHAAVAELAVANFELDAAQAAIDQALEINPRLLAAHWALADVHFSNVEPRKAIPVLEAALKWNPTSAGTLGRLATAYAAVDGTALDGTAQEKAAASRAGKVIDAAMARNPHPGEFWATVGDAFDRLRRYPPAAIAYRKAIDCMPQLLAPRGAWGMVLMRLGEETEARKVLDAAFEADPFNVRVSNTLKVLEVLDGYETLETAHFRVRFDPKHDKLLAQYAAGWLEEVYPLLCKQMGYAPADKSLFEIFNKAKHTDGHGWFSARMVGLPHIHTIGACAGKMVAMQSPIGGQPFNWGRVLKHEFIHVLNLQQTHFNVPHWYTEALATLNEGYPRPQSWNDLLIERLKNDKLFDLDSINLGFIRAHSGDEWNLAYCQAELYAEYMLARFGDDALAKMLAAYAENLTTREAIRHAFQIDQAEFERGYKDYVAKLVAGLAANGPPREKSLSELQAALKADPRNPGLLAQMALAQFRRKQYPEARRLVDAARKGDPREPLAAYVRARLHLLVGENSEGLKMLQDALDEQHPQPQLLALLAGLKLKSEDYAGAARLYELGARDEPDNIQWTKSLAALYLKSDQPKKLAPLLAKLAENDAEDFTVRKKLADIALHDEDYAGVERWTVSGLHIDVLDPDLHAWRAQAALKRDDPALAADELAAGLEIDPENNALRFSLADAERAAGKPAQARATLAELLRRDPKYPGAEALLKSLP